MEVGALEPEPPEGEVDLQQLQAAFELRRRAAYRPGEASGKGGEPGGLGPVSYTHLRAHETSAHL
eukprot:3914040-Alexandrium_andersonii.AAC.1